MTPLAHRIVKELTLPIKDRTFDDQCGLLKQMDDIHCFDATEVWPLVLELAADMLGRDEWLIGTAFLPAPKTWVEVNDETGRWGFLLERVGDRVADVRFAGRNGSAETPKTLWLGSAVENNPTGSQIHSVEDHFARVAVALLAIINSPRTVGRKQHMPHRGLEKRLLAKRNAIGKFPLHAWTELKLKVSDMWKTADGVVHEAHITGKRCRHFCRAHLRIQNGKVVFVNAHWRGDGSLGIKQTRYRLTA